MSIAKTAKELLSGFFAQFPCGCEVGFGDHYPQVDVGGVVIGLRSNNEVKRAFDSIKAKLAKPSVKGECRGLWCSAWWLEESKQSLVLHGSVFRAATMSR